MTYELINKLEQQASRIVLLEEVLNKTLAMNSQLENTILQLQQSFILEAQVNA